MPDTTGDSDEHVRCAVPGQAETVVSGPEIPGADLGELTNGLVATAARRPSTERSSEFVGGPPPPQQEHGLDVAPSLDGVLR